MAECSLQIIIVELNRVDLMFVLVVGNGSGFCAGADLSGDTNLMTMLQNKSYTLEMQQRTSGIVVKMRRSPQIFIGAINGKQKHIRLWLSCGH